MATIITNADENPLQNQQDVEYSDFELIENISGDIIQEFSENAHDEIEVYHCSVCDSSFTDIMQHIKAFHKNQSILIEAGEKKVTKYAEHHPNLQDSNCHRSVERNDVYSISDHENSTINESNDFIICGNNSKELNRENDTNDESGDFNIRSKICQDENPSLISSPVMVNASYLNFASKTCSICKTIFSSTKNLKLHGRMHNPVKSKSYTEALSENGNHSLTLFYCELCKKSFDVKLQDQHLKLHRGIAVNNICKICNKQFKSMESYYMHLTLHEDKKDNATVFSLKKLASEGKNEIIHPYACQHCNKTFKRPHEKVKHERIHTGEKPFKCDVCGKSFRVSYSLTLHLRTHTGVRPYVCRVCNKRFKGYSTYANHSQTHSEERKFKCPECSKTFKTAVQMHGHKNTHKKPFFCSLCSRPFATMHSVEVHMETHKNETSKKKFKYFCNICGASYGRSFALEEHKKEMHNTLDGIEKHLEYFSKEEDIISTECILSTDDLFRA